MRSASPVLVAAACALALLVLAPDSADLAAASFRSDLFAREGFTLFNTAWYGGHHTPGYSILAPPLGALLGERVLAALSVVAATAAFMWLAGRTAAFLVIPALVASVVSGRVAFTLGAAFAIAAVAAATRGRPWLAGGAAFLAALSSPVASMFTALAAAALVLAGEQRRAAVVMGVAAFVPTSFLVLAFPEGGTFPFVSSAFWPAFAAAIAVAAVAPRRSPLQIGAALYAVLLAGAFLIDSPVGGNAVRLGTLIVVPIAAALLWPKRRLALALLALPLAYWVLQPAVRDWMRTLDDPSVNAAYHEPLTDFLERREPVRVEIPLTQNHGEAEHVAPKVAIGRGWLRQLDIDRNGLFYEKGALSPLKYERWLNENAIAYVALPEGLPLDKSGEEEKALIVREPAFLRPVARRGRWRIFRVRRPKPLATRPARLTSLKPEGFRLTFARPGATTVRVRYTPYWDFARGFGCIAEAKGGWTRVRSRSKGRIEVRTRFALGSVFRRGRRCAGG